MKNTLGQKAASAIHCSKCGDRLHSTVIYEEATGQPMCHRCWNSKARQILIMMRTLI